MGNIKLCTLRNGKGSIWLILEIVRIHLSVYSRLRGQRARIQRESVCVLMVKILNKCIPSILVYNLFNRQDSLFPYTGIFPYSSVIGCIDETEIQIFKLYSFLIGRKNRLRHQ